MNKSPRTGICRLCHLAGDLNDSHYLPASSYKIIRRDAGNKSPVVTSGEKSFFSDKQVRDYLLCRLCEERFNEKGESWFLAHCYRGAGNFRLKELIETIVPSRADRDVAAYSAMNVPEINSERLAYFAASILWRGAAHDWPTEDGPIEPIRLGARYQEGFRQYLLGNAPFPSNAILYVSVIPSKDWSSPMCLPRGGKINATQLWHYYFTIQGVSFTFLLGNVIPAHARKTNTYPSKEKWFFMGPLTTDLLITDLSFVRETTPVGKLKDYQ